MPYVVKPVVDPARLAGPQPDIPADDLVLRRWTSGDAGQLVAAFADPQIQKWNLRTVESEEEARRIIAAWKQSWKRHTAASWAIVAGTEPAVVLGQVGFRALYAVDGMAELSYWVAPGQRRRGVASTAARALADWAIDRLQLERLELVHSTLNTASCRVALAAGFEVEGTKRRLQRHADGWHDMHLHSRVRGDRSPAPAGLRSRLAERIDRPVRAGGRPAALIG